MDVATQKPTILVVDDDYITHHIINVILNSQRYTLVSAYNGLEAITQLERTGTVDLILTDIYMPFMNGLDLLDQIRSTDQYRDVPIVMISASPLSNIPEEAMEKGATAFISQPFSSWELTRVVSQCLESTPGDIFNTQPFYQ
jgi:two-component system, chemotaxis family, sensor histidine kinase and response regulator PixL